MKQKKKILFISVDGTQNYLESLFLPLLVNLPNDSIDIEVLEFCLKNSDVRKKYSNKKYQNKIKIYFADYFNAPPVIGSFIFILYGAFKLFKLIKKEKPNILMPRSLVAGAMVLLIKPFYKNIKIILETDGLVADERVDFGGWSRTGLLYKVFKKIEKKLIDESVYVTTRTKKAKQILINRSSLEYDKKIIVIPNGKEMDIIDNIEVNYRTKIRNKLHIEKSDLVFIYVGTIGTQYEPELMINIFKHIQQNINHSKMIILTPNQDEIKKVISKYSGLDKNIFIDTVHPHQVNQYIEAADLGFALRTPSFSQQAICPIKLIEYLMIGLPVISNSGVGDLDELYSKHNIGYIIKDLNSVNYQELDEYIDQTFLKNKELRSKKIKEIAKIEFDLNQVIEKYNMIFSRV